MLDDAGRLATSGRRTCVTAALSPDGDRVLTDNGGVLRLWDARTGEQVARLDRQDESVTAFAFADGGRRVHVRFEEHAAVFDAGERQARRLDAPARSTRSPTTARSGSRSATTARSTWSS